MDVDVTLPSPASVLTERLRVLIATDESEVSQAAAKQAASVLPVDADFVLVTVIDSPEDPMANAGGLEGPVMDDDEAEARYRESVIEAEGSLAVSARAFGARPLRQRVVERDGKGVGARICALAREEEAELIVIGSHGHRALFDLLLGSVSNYVLRHSPCPVLVVPRG
ncbi:MAG: universal stress protein [Acidimicrobiia bacterium]